MQPLVRILRISRFSILPIIFVLFCLAACGGQAPAEPPPTPTQTTQEALGDTVFSRECARCHSLEPDTVIVGPSLRGIGERAGTRVPGQDANEYMLVSVLDPADYLVEGFEDLMPTTLGTELTGEELDAVIAFLLTQ